MVSSSRLRRARSNPVYIRHRCKQKNLKTLLDEHLQDYTTRIITEPTLRCFNDSGLSLASDAITPTLFGLLSTGKENCCREVGAKEPATPVQLSLLENVEEDKNEPETAATATEEKAEVKTEEKDSKKNEKSRKKPKWQQTLINMFADFKDNMTEDEENDDE